ERAAITAIVPPLPAAEAVSGPALQHDRATPLRAPKPSPEKRGAMAARYFTSWMRLTVAAYFGPYLSQTGFTASWNAFLSAAETSMIWMPAAFALSIACFS